MWSHNLVFLNNNRIAVSTFGTILAALVGCEASSAPANTPQPLVIYCAASNKGVLEAIKTDYEREQKVTLEIEYGPSQTLLATLTIARTGDLYLPADDSYLALAREKDLLAEEFPLGTMQLVLAVAKGNPKQIAGLADLVKDEVRLVQANPDAAAVGKLTREALTKSGQWEALNTHTNAFVTTVNEVANTLKVGAADAGFVYDVTLRDYGTLEAIEVPEVKGVTARVTVGVLKSSSHPEQALALARYLAAPEQGQVRYREFGFGPATGK